MTDTLTKVLAQANLFGPQLRQIREARGWSLTKAAEETGIPAMVIGSYERGDRQPTAVKMAALLAHYDCRLVIVPNGADTDDQLDNARKLHDLKQFFVDGYERIVKESA